MQNFLRYCGLCESRETSRVLERQQPRILGREVDLVCHEGSVEKKPRTSVLIQSEPIRLRICELPVGSAVTRKGDINLRD